MKVAIGIIVSLGLGVALSAPALGTITTSHLSGDAELSAILPEDNIAFVAEGRVGDLEGHATFELDLGQSTAAPETTAQYAWRNGESESFAVTYDHGTGVVSFNLGGKTLYYFPSRVFSEIFIRTRAVEDGSTVSAHDLVVDGESVNDQSSAAGPDGLDILRIQGATLSDDFVLVGQAVLSWPGDAPSQSRLAFQIKVGEPEPPVSAQPATWGWIKVFFRGR
jgi:hypothetical protein